MSCDGFVCRDCGVTATGCDTHDGTTWHLGDCSQCERKQVPVTELRDFTESIPQ